MHKVHSWAKHEARTALDPFRRRVRPKDREEEGVALESPRTSTKGLIADAGNGESSSTSAKQSDDPTQGGPQKSPVDDTGNQNMTLQERKQYEKQKKKDGKKHLDRDIDKSLWGQLKASVFNTYLNILLVAVPVGIALHFTSVSPTVIFVVNFIAIIPLAGMLSYATEELALRVGETLGGLLNASFGNAVELIVAIIALVKKEIVVVQTSLIGSILSNLLLVLGMAFLFGGWNRFEQYFNTTVAQTASSLLSLAVTSLIVPTAFHWSAVGSSGDIATGILELSRGTAIILLLVYGTYLFFQLKSHAALFQMPSKKVAKRNDIKNATGDATSVGEIMAQVSANVANSAATGHAAPHTQTHPDDEDDDAPKPELLLVTALVLLGASTVLVAICAEFLVDAINDVVNATKISRYFVGLILLPIVGNAAEHVTSVTVACKDKMDLAIGVCVGSSMQIALLVIPFIVTLGWILHIDDMTLYFDGFQVIILLVSILLVNYLIQDGKSNFLEGVLLIATYIIIALAAYLYPNKPDDSPA